MVITKRSTAVEETDDVDVPDCDPSVVVDSVCFSYGSDASEVPVLQDVSFGSDGAELISIIGPNGVGKSTLMHCLNRILTPTSGTVTIDGKDVQETPLKELAKKVSYVPCFSNETFPMPVVDAVMLGRHPYSRWNTLENDLDIVYDSLRMVGMEDLAMRPFNELSAGQHQKVMLARGFAQCTHILLLDEPTANLDIKHQLEVTRLLRDFAHERNMLIIMISHDLNIAAKYSDRLIMLSEGTVYAMGRPADVITEGNIRHVYGVESKVVDVNGVPHIILLDEGETVTGPVRSPSHPGRGPPSGEGPDRILARDNLAPVPSSA